jgi:DNA-binding MarR family transcriptional regulator
MSWIMLGGSSQKPLCEFPLKPPHPSANRRRSARRPLSDADYKAMGAFRLALRRFAAFSEAAAQAVGITAQQHQALLAIRAHDGPEPMSISELAECLLIKNHSAVELVARLVARGLVTRTPAEVDRRRIQLRLTPEAEQVLEAITRNNLNELSSTVPVLRDLLRTVRRIGKMGERGSGGD